MPYSDINAQREHIRKWKLENKEKVQVQKRIRRLKQNLNVKSRQKRRERLQKWRSNNPHKVAEQKRRCRENKKRKQRLKK